MIREMRRTPAGNEGPSTKTVVETVSSVRARRVAALRLPPLECGRRDPMDPDSSGGVLCLFPAELRAEASRCLALGWQLWEIQARFGLVRKGGVK